jgi:hypothetical protein
MDCGDGEDGIYSGRAAGDLTGTTAGTPCTRREARSHLTQPQLSFSTTVCHVGSVCSGSISHWGFVCAGDGFASVYSSFCKLTANSR